MAEFSHETEALAGIYDLLASLLAVVMALGGAKAPDIKPYPRPRPRTAAAAARSGKDEARKAHRELVARLIPGQGAGDGV